MYKVYWTDEEGNPCAVDFSDMTLALQHTQDLRNIYKRRFVTLVSEIPECTSLLGVSSPPADYSWRKRR